MATPRGPKVVLESGVPVKFHDVMLALSKAKAAILLLQEMDDRSGAFPGAGNIERDYGFKPDDAEGWIRTIALESAVAAIREAEAAFVKSKTAPKEAA